MFWCFHSYWYKPNTDIFRGSLDMDDTGYLTSRVVRLEMQRNVLLRESSAAGDVSDSIYRQAITSAGGCMAALDAEKVFR